MAKIPENIRNISLEGLHTLKEQTSAPVYAGMIKSALKGREMTNLKARFLVGKIADNSRECELQEDLLGFMRTDLDEARQEIQAKADVVSQKEADKQTAYEEFLAAKEKLEKASQELETARAAMKKAESDYEALEESMEIAEKRKNDIDTIVLVHRSANLGQLMDYNFGKVIVTQADAKFLNGLITADEVFDSELAAGLIGSIPYEFGKLDKERAVSIIQFVEMAMYYYLIEDRKVVMLYANSDIATILKKEGV